MSIKYLQDQQLNQVQQSPNDSPWAKLVAQSEMLERNKMRQPQGQAPQGTVAGNIQQQLMAAQQQESEKQNADLQKAQMIAQLIGSGHLPANFAAQGYAGGGLTQPQAGTGAYRGIMMPSQGAGANPSYAPQQPVLSYIPPSSQDPAAQEKKHGMMQSMLDNSIVGMAQGKANIGNAMQDYADLFSGKAFSRGFAEGGDIRGFAGGGGLENFLNRYPSHPSTIGIKPYLEPAAGTRFQDVPELQKVLSEAKTNNQLAELLRQDPSALDKVNTFFKNQPKGLPYIPQISESPELQEYYKSLYEPKTRGDVYNSLAQRANAPTTTDSGVEQMKIPPRGSVLPQEQPNVGPRVDPTAEFKSRMYGENSGINPARSNLMGTLFNVAEQKEAVNPARSNLMGTLLNVAEQKEALANQPKPSMVEQMSAAAKQNPLDTMWAKMSEADRLNAMHRASIQPETAPAPSMTEGMSVAAQNPPRIDTMASQMSATDKANNIKLGDPMSPGATTLEEVAAKAKQGLGSLGEAAKAVGRPIAKVAGALSPIGDLAMANKFTGGSNALLAQVLSGQTPSSAMQGDIPEVAKDLITAPSLPDWAKNIGSAIKSSVPSVPQTDISQFGVDTKAAIPQQPTIGDFSGSATPQTKGPAANDKGVIANPNSANKHESTTANIAAINQAHGQGQTQATSPVTQAVQQAATVAQADQAANKSSDTGMGQGSILDSLYSKLKDTDVDYSDLAKRISENEYDLARERKDGTFNAILGGVGAALSKAGTYESHGDRVFRPGLGAIAGAGITGGLKMANESDAETAKKSQANTASMLALKKLKGDSLNNVLDAISAQKQVDAITRGQDITAGTHKLANQTAMAKVGVESRLADIADLSAKADAMYKSAQAKKLNIEVTDANDKLLVDSLNKQLGDYANLLSGADKNSLSLTPEQRQGYQARLDGTQSQLDAIYAKYGSAVPKIKPLNSGQYSGFRDLTNQ